MSELQKNILIVEDDAELADWMKVYLCSRGFSIEIIARGDEVLHRLEKQSQPDLIVLDGMLPGLDGLEVCRQVRLKYDLPIIMLTARDEEVDEIIGFEMGADDYITKPVKARVLLARINAQFRRHVIDQKSKTSNATGQLIFNQLCIELNTRSVMMDGKTINISSNEFDLLWILASQAGKIVYRKDLVSQLRGFEYDGLDRSIDLRVSRLRKKLGDDSEQPHKIKTVWGKGYFFSSEAW